MFDTTYGLAGALRRRDVAEEGSWILRGVPKKKRFAPRCVIG